MSKKQMKTGFYLLVLSALLFTFQNCDSPYQSRGPQGSGLAVSESGNGDSYDGKLVVSAPTVAQNGQAVEISIQGGLPPYKLSSSVEGSIPVETSPGIYSLTIPRTENKSTIVVSAYDQAGTEANATIRIWGVNRWFFQAPSSVSTDDAGNIYIIEEDRPAITQIDQNGEVLQVWEKENTEGLDLAGVNRLTVHPNGYAYLLKDHSELVILDLEKNRLVHSAEGVPSEEWSECGGAKDIALTLDSRIAVLCETTVFILSTTGELQSAINLESTNQARAIAYELTGEIVVAVPGGKINKYTANGELLGTIQVNEDGEGIGAHHVPRQLIVWDEDRLVYTTEESPGQSTEVVIVFKETGNRTWFNLSGESNQVRLSDMYGLGVLPNGSLVTTERKGRSVVIFGKDRRVEKYFGRKGTGDFMFRAPVDVEIKGGITTVLDSGNNRMTQYDSTGRFLREIPGLKTESGDNALTDAGDLALDDNGLIYVLNRFSHKIDIYNSDGYLRSLGSGQGSGQSHLDKPAGIEICDGKILIADSGNSRVKVWTLTGEPILDFRAWGTPQSVTKVGENYAVLERFGDSQVQIHDKNGKRLHQLENPLDLGLDEISEPSELIYSKQLDQYFIVERLGHRIITWGGDGKIKKVLGEYGFRHLQFARPTGIALDFDGNLFVGDTGNARIQIVPAYLLKQ